MPNFIVDRDSKLVLRDTRNLALALLAAPEMPGGDTSKENKDLLDQVPIRKTSRRCPLQSAPDDRPERRRHGQDQAAGFRRPTS